MPKQEKLHKVKLEKPDHDLLGVDNKGNYTLETKYLPNVAVDSVYSRMGDRNLYRMIGSERPASVEGSVLLETEERLELQTPEGTYLFDKEK